MNIFKPFQNLFVPVIEDKSQNIYRYGYDNLLPNKLIQWINESGVAKRCVNKVATYISADGFSEEATKTFKVNPFQTSDELLEQIRFDLAYFKGFALVISRDRSGKIVSAKHTPFQSIRKTLRGDFLINPTLGTKDYKKEKGEYYPKYKGVTITPIQLAEQIKNYGNKGEIYYVYEETPDNPHYPVPDYYAGIENIRTSSKIQQFDLNMVLNAFMPSAILTLVGTTDDKTQDKYGKTQRDYLNESLDQFTLRQGSQTGETNAGGLLVLEAKTKDEIPSLQTFDAKAIVDSSNSKREVVDRAVCRDMGVHPVLVGFSDAAILGNTQSIANASIELNNNVNGLQRMIERAMKNVYPLLDWSITKFNPVSYIPESVMNDLTQTERRELFGFPELIVEGVETKPLLIEKLGVGGTQAFTQILSDVNLSVEQKRATLTLLFGISSEDVLKLVPDVNPIP
jgi:hypothetical protein